MGFRIDIRGAAGRNGQYADDPTHGALDGAAEPGLSGVPYGVPTIPRAIYLGSLGQVFAYVGRLAEFDCGENFTSSNGSMPKRIRAITDKNTVTLKLEHTGHSKIG